MCTAATYQTKAFYFGRTLDYEMSFGEEIVILPKNYPLRYLEEKPMDHHFAMIGMACVMDGAPLYYDAVNEKGLAMAGLNFVGNACYNSHTEGKHNIAQFELIPWLLSQCENVDQVRTLLFRTNILGTPFKPSLPAAQLHWLIADRKQAITLECVSDGMMIYDNPVGILTNNPPFPQQLFQLNNYRHLSAKSTQNSFAPSLPLLEYSRGMGALGLPGDLSSQSRFIRAAFTKLNSVSGEGETESVSQFFQILNTVSQTRGCCELENGKQEITLYTSCCNTDKGIYYYTTYDNHQISAINMHREDLESSEIRCYPLITEEQIYLQN